VVAYKRDDGATLMKRAAGLPGEAVQLTDDRRLLVDGQEVDVPAGLNSRFLRYGTLFEGRPIPCGDGFYVLGDDLKDSDDSRFNGPVRADRIVGRAWLIVWPLERFGFVR
jgi:signal peptidase I